MDGIHPYITELGASDRGYLILPSAGWGGAGRVPAPHLAYANYLRILGIGTQHPIPTDPCFWVVKLV